LTALAGLATPATAEVPATLDRVSEETAIYVALPDLGGFAGDLTALFGRIQPALPPEAGQIAGALPLVNLMVNQPGMDPNGAAIVVIEPIAGEPDEADPFAALIPQGAGVRIVLPVTDFDQFAAGPFIAPQAEEIEPGVLRVALQFPPVEFFIRDLDGFAVAGATLEDVKAHGTPRGELGAHREALGAIGDRMSDSNDIVITASVAAFEGGVDMLLEMLNEQAPLLASVEGGEMILPALEVVETAVRGFVRDGATGMLGIDISADGLSIDLGTNFKTGSEVAELFSKGGDSGSLMASVPNDDQFIFAYASDSTADGLKTIAARTEELLPPEFADATAADLNAMLATGGRVAYLIAPPEDGGASGFLSNQITYAESTERGFLDKIRDAIRGLDGQSFMGVGYETKYDDGAARVGDQRVDRYAITSAIDLEGLGAEAGAIPIDPAMIQTLIYGPSGGPDGYVATADDGVFLTVSTATPLLERALAGGASLDDNRVIRVAASRLPSRGRVGEAYFSLSNFLNTIVPLAQGFGMDVEGMVGEIPEMPAIAAGAVVEDGGMLVRLHIPTEVALYGAEIANQLNEAGLFDDLPAGPAF
ncbi:MAG: hypothetical protein AAFU70_05580, partial [Planctomycetota bacterium]